MALPSCLDGIKRIIQLEEDVWSIDQRLGQSDEDTVQQWVPPICNKNVNIILETFPTVFVGLKRSLHAIAMAYMVKEDAVEASRAKMWRFCTEDDMVYIRASKRCGDVLELMTCLYIVAFKPRGMVQL
jgi:hypothetical protein